MYILYCNILYVSVFKHGGSLRLAFTVSQGQIIPTDLPKWTDRQTDNCNLNIMMCYTLYRQMRLLLRHYGIETTEIPEEPTVYGGPPPPSHRRASEGLEVGSRWEAPPPASASSPRHSWPNAGVSRGQIGGVFSDSSRVQGFAAAMSPLQVLYEI